ncbi:MAG: ankyrin repeat domain-containing protein [Gammaproteobacteria bacterium]
MPDHVYALPPGYMLAEYRIDRVLGSGGFGITYYAWDTHLDKPVAVKEYLPNESGLRAATGRVQPKSSAAAADFQWGLDRFLDEARTLARFEHPHINKVHRFFSANGTAYMVLEYIDGETLSAVLRRDGRLAPARLRRLLAELLSALEAVHGADYVHRDVKPGNIMLRATGSAVLLDFGIALQAIGERSKSITSVLTPIYAPIEQYGQDANRIGAWTDLYAVGIVAYRCVSGIGAGELPDAVTRENWKRREEAGSMKSAVEVGAGKYDEDLLGAVDYAIEVYENERPRSVVAMRDALGVFASFWSAESKQLGQKFLGRDFSPTAKDANGWTDLHYAAAGNWMEVAEFLLGAGADVDAETRDDRDAPEMFNNAMVNTLNKITNGDWNIAYEYWFDIIDADEDMFACDSHIPLHLAALANADKVAALLLKNGANIEAQDGFGQMPLHLAALANADKVAALLLKNGADIEAKDYLEQTPLHLAARANADKVAALLIENDAAMAPKDCMGLTPLHIAVKENADKIAALLLENGEDVYVESMSVGGFALLGEAAVVAHRGGGKRR